jgi:hypothetical protein
VLIPAGARHGFRNIGSERLHVRATLASSIFEGQYDSTKETSRRWSPQPRTCGPRPQSQVRGERQGRRLGPEMRRR